MNIQRSKKSRRNSSYHVLMIPEDSSQIHRVRLRNWQLRLSIFATIVFALGLILTTSGYMRYQGLYRKTADVRARYGGLQEQQARLAQRLVQLEATVERAESLAGKVDALISPQLAENIQGVGPIENRNRKPVGDIEKFSTLTQLDANVFADHFSNLMKNMQTRSLGVENQVISLYQRYQDHMVRLSSTPSIWPVEGWITSPFGQRRSPLGGRSRFHDGIDIAARWGAPVLATGDAVVKFAGYKGGLGKTIILEHDFGIQTVYAHNSKLLVKEGSQVTRGEQIAAIGNTGYSTGPHCHFEVHVDGMPVDPMNYMPHRTDLTQGKSKSKNL